jgi:hypothetical protein
MFLSWLLLGSDPDRSVDLANAALDANEQTGDLWVRASGHQHLGMAALLDGDDGAAAPNLAIALEAYAKTRNRNDIKLSLIAASTLLLRRGLVAEASAAMAVVDTFGGSGGLGEFEIELFDRIGGVPTASTDSTIDLAEVVGLLRSAATDEPATGPPSSGQLPTFKQVGDLWEIGYQGASALMPASKGIGDIAVLVSQPGVEVSCLDLMGSGLAPGSFDVASDDLARSEYKAKIVELQAELVEAEDHHDPYRADQIRDEMDRLLEHLNSAYGLSGRTRSEGDPAEKARSAVTARIRFAMNKMWQVHPGLAGHLDRSIRTGRFCIYDPESTGPSKS